MSEQPLLASPEVNAASLATSIEAAFTHYADAVRQNDNGLPVLTLYTDRRRPNSKVTIHPTWGAEDITGDGYTSITQTTAEGTINFMLLRRGNGSDNSVSRVLEMQEPVPAVRLVAVRRQDLDKLQQTIIEGSPERPPRLLARLQRIGNLARKL
jgi:hypothetical protein